MNEYARITADHLFYPKIQEFDDFFRSVKDLTGAVAMIAVQLSPYPYPDNLDVVVLKLTKRLQVHADEINFIKFKNIFAVQAMLKQELREIPEYLAWNERKNGNTSSFAFTDRYSDTPHPDNDFIDLDAFERTASLHIAQGARLFRDFNDDFTARHHKELEQEAKHEIVKENMSFSDYATKAQMLSVIFLDCISRCNARSFATREEYLVAMHDMLLERVDETSDEITKFINAMFKVMEI